MLELVKSVGLNPVDVGPLVRALQLEQMRRRSRRRPADPEPLLAANRAVPSRARLFPFLPTG